MAVTAYLKSKKLLPFVFALQMWCGWFLFQNLTQRIVVSSHSHLEMGPVCFVTINFAFCRKRSIQQRRRWGWIIPPPPVHKYVGVRSVLESDVFHYYLK